MSSVGIVSGNGREMARAFMRLSEGKANCYHITSEQPLGPKVNVLIAAEAAPVLTTILPALSKDDYLVVNADDRAIFPLLASSEAKLITYGFNNKACITASSVTDDGVQVCIQRAFYGIDGAEKLPQEFSARGREHSTSLLGASAAWAVLKPGGDGI